MVLPAYAGMIPLFILLFLTEPSAPRIRGDDPTKNWETDDLILSAPRIRGDDPGMQVTKEYVKGCSPHTRG